MTAPVVFGRLHVVPVMVEFLQAYPEVNARLALGDRIVNLLDTPGHEDFSEDTYRTLTAVDSALMVIDCAKGVETRTIKLMEVCRLRDTPIMTFINKLDREGREPIELLDEIETVFLNKKYDYLFLSTSKGLMSGDQARKANIGGEILVKVF